MTQQVSAEMAAFIKGMLARGDFQHRIAQHFGINQARVAEVKSGELHPEVKPAEQHRLPAFRPDYAEQMRDRFAMAALPMLQRAYGTHPDQNEAMARMAYGLADAMMAERLRR